MTLAEPTPSPPMPQPEAAPEQAGKPRLLRKLLRAETGIILLAVTPIAFLVLSLSGVINGAVRFKPISFPWDKPTKCDTFLAEITRENGDYQPDVPFGSWKANIIARYLIHRDDTLTSLPVTKVILAYQPYQLDTESHQEAWHLVRAIIAPEERAMLAEFDIVSDGQSIFLGSLTPNQHYDEFILSVDIIDAVNPNQLTYVILHEYAHYLTLNHTQIDAAHFSATEPDCTLYYCARDDSYLANYFQKFWVNIQAEWVEGEGFYSKYRFDFVSRYAMTSPEEDIAETLTHFFLRTKPTYPEVVADKIQFFYHYRELVRLRKEIRQNICNYFEIGK